MATPPAATPEATMPPAEGTTPAAPAAGAAPKLLRPKCPPEAAPEATVPAAPAEGATWNPTTEPAAAPM